MYVYHYLFINSRTFKTLTQWLVVSVCVSGQNTFDAANCTLPGMDNPLASCSIPCSYGDSNPFGQMAAQGYRYNGVRTFPPNPAMSSANCSMVPRPREHPQAPVFPSGK